MRSVVDVITTRRPAAYSRRATAKPIPSALPAPVITAVCLFNGRVMEMPGEGIIHRPGRGGSLYLLVFQVHGWLDRSFFARHFQKLGVKLHERMFDGGVLVMALPAIILAWRGRTGSFFRSIETEISPLVREAFLIFDFHVEAHEVALITAVLVDRTLRSRTVQLQDEQGFVRPVAMGEIVVVGGRIDEDVCEHHHAVVGLLRVAQDR